MMAVVFSLGMKGEWNAEITSLKQTNKEMHDEITQLMSQSAIWRKKAIDLQEENTFQFMEIESLKKKSEELVRKNTELQIASLECAEEREQLQHQFSDTRYRYRLCNKELRGEGKLLNVRLNTPIFSANAGIHNPFSKDEELERLEWEQNKKQR